MKSRNEATARQSCASSRLFLCVCVVSAASLWAPNGEAAVRRKKAAPTEDVASNAGPAAASAADALRRLEALHDSLEYEEVIRTGQSVLKRTDLTIDQQVEALRFIASAKAVIEDPVDAEGPFRAILRLQPEFDLPKETPPKIMSIFRKVQSEERALRDRAREYERSNIIKSLRLLGDPPRELPGGRPVLFRFHLIDPGHHVQAIRIPFRRSGVPEYSSLALEATADGYWEGQIPGAVTSDEKGFRLEYFVETYDARGALLSLGTPKDPLTMNILPGVVRTETAPIPKWAFVTGAATSGVFGAAAGGLGIGTFVTQQRYKALACEGCTADGATLARLERTGQLLATGTNAALIALGVAVVATSVMAPFVEWNATP